MTPTQLVTCNRALALVCLKYGVAPSEILGPSRQQRHVWPRWVAIRLTLDHDPVDYLDLARFFGRGRSDIYKVVEEFSNRIHADPKAAGDYAQLKAKFAAGNGGAAI